MRYEGIVLFVMILFITGLAVIYRTNNYVPTRVLNFCQVKHEVYNDSYEECIKMYKEHQK